MNEKIKTIKDIIVELLPQIKKYKGIMQECKEKQAKLTENTLRINQAIGEYNQNINSLRKRLDELYLISKEISDNILDLQNKVSTIYLINIDKDKLPYA